MKGTTRLAYDPKTDRYFRVVGMALTYRERALLNSHPATRLNDGRHLNGRRSPAVVPEHRGRTL